MCGTTLQEYEPFVIIALNILIDLVLYKGKRLADLTEQDRANFILIESKKNTLNKSNRKLWAKVKQSLTVPNN